MAYQASWRCSFQVLAALTFASTLVMTFVDADEEFRLLEVNRVQSSRSSKVELKFQGPAPYDGVLLKPKGSIRVRGDIVTVKVRSSAEDVTFVLKQPDAFYTLVLNELDVPPRVKGRRPPVVNKTQAFPAVDLIFPDVLTYPAGNNVTFDVEVTSGGVARSGIVSEDLTFQTYVKASDTVFNAGDADLLSVIDKTEEEGRSVFHVNLHADGDGGPRGLAIIKASVVFLPEASPIVKELQVEKMMEFYNTEQGSALDGGSMAYFRREGTWNLRTQACDMDLPKCVVSCTVISREPVQDFVMMRVSSYDRSLEAKQETSFGVISTLSHVIDDVDGDAEDMYGCSGKIGEGGETGQQIIEVKVKQQVSLLTNISAAELRPDQTLEVRCAAEGRPNPHISITADDDPNESLWDRFPSESFPRFYEFGNSKRVRYTLSKPSFTSSLTHVTCKASNDFGTPVQTVLQVVPVA